jgi:gamma-glutamyltranspeptidase/glutathione hydrolase
MDYDAEALAEDLIARGHSNPAVPADERSVGIITQTSGLSIIQVGESDTGERIFIGGADKRRDGAVGGS